MATFEEQIEGLTNLTITSTSNPSQDDITQYIIDGINDVTHRCTRILPIEARLFTRDSGLQTSNGFDTEGADVISVVRADGATAGAFRDCRRISISEQYMVTDSTSLLYASSYNPAYMHDNDGTISVFPAPSDNSGKDSYKVYYINNNHDYVDYDSEDIQYFPKQKVYLVMIFAAIKALEAKMAEFAITEEDIELVQGIQANLGALKKQYDDAFLLMQPKGGE
jgi:hypothetical protein